MDPTVLDMQATDWFYVIHEEDKLVVQAGKMIPLLTVHVRTKEELVIPVAFLIRSFLKLRYEDPLQGHKAFSITSALVILEFNDFDDFDDFARFLGQKDKCIVFLSHHGDVSWKFIISFNTRCVSIRGIVVRFKVVFFSWSRKE
eukprot:TRINITY_DN19767_c0_g1_i1.p1 TRINITY_DN19767_c0_g1~~TRINITY_DN19767_c0_g1_i1.p1  ORF type:complete len:144 (+),score=14.77 TRINITY_DN19767_c0_g1_i1:319-750(+)